MKNIRKIILSALFTVLGTAAVFADVIDPGQPRPDPLGPEPEATAAQGGMIMLVIIVIAIVIVILVAMLTNRGRHGGDAPVQAATAAVMGAAAGKDAEADRQLDIDNQASGEIMNTDAEEMQAAPEIAAAANENAAVDTGSAGLGGEIGGDLG